MGISKEEKEYFRYYFNQVKTKDDFKQMVYCLYVDHEYSYTDIVVLSRHCFSKKINISMIIKILEEFDVKRCSKKEDCKNPDGCLQSRDNFYNHKKTSDKKEYICSFCYNFDRKFRRANQNKQNCMLEFQKIKEKEEQDEFLINIYKDGLDYVDLVTISLRKMESIISLLEEFDIKRCNKGEDCKNPNGWIQSRDNFYNKNTKDGKDVLCSFCYNFDRNFKKANKTKQKHMLEFQKIKNAKERDEFLVNLYKNKFKIKYLISVSLRDFDDLLNLLKKYDIKRCANPLCKNPIQSRVNFSKNSITPDGLQDRCQVCRKEDYLKNKDYICEQHKMHRKNNSEVLKKRQKKYNYSFGKYDTYASQIDFIDKVRRDPKNNELIQVQCKLCKEWFNPTNSQLKMRVNAINGDRISIGTENHLYCSEECKGLCPLYKTRVSELITQQRLKNNKLIENDFERMQFELRKYFLKIKNPDRCELCGEELDQKDLILHHIVPVTINNMFEADIDNLIFICQKCHNLSHQKDGCTIKQLSQISIENKLC